MNQSYENRPLQHHSLEAIKKIAQSLDITLYNLTCYNNSEYHFEVNGPTDLAIKSLLRDFIEHQFFVVSIFQIDNVTSIRLSRPLYRVELGGRVLWQGSEPLFLKNLKADALLKTLKYLISIDDGTTWHLVKTESSFEVFNQDACLTFQHSLFSYRLYYGFKKII